MAWPHGVSFQEPDRHSFIHEVQVSANLPVDGARHPWQLAFRQYSFYHIGQPLRNPLGSLWPVSTRFIEDALFTFRFPFMLTSFDL